MTPVATIEVGSGGGSTGPRLEEMSEAECFRLLGAGGLGRVAVSVNALPHIVPVNYALDGRDIVFATRRLTKLVGATRQVVVAFEIDGTDTFGDTGWSVEVTGTGSVVNDPEDIERCRRLALRPWARQEDGCFIRIRPAGITGRRFTYPAGPTGR